jgi:hypothetical protein
MGELGVYFTAEAFAKAYGGILRLNIPKNAKEKKVEVA